LEPIPLVGLTEIALEMTYKGGSLRLDFFESCGTERFVCGRVLVRWVISLQMERNQQRWMKMVSKIYMGIMRLGIGEMRSEMDANRASSQETALLGLGVGQMQLARRLSP
jgi:hypothetical protein